MTTAQGMVEEIGGVLLVRLQEEQSAALPARSMVMGEGTLNGAPFTAPLEPDGRGGHWLEISTELARQAGIKVGEKAGLKVAPAKTWPEPELPREFMAALAAEGLQGVWDSLTVKARWEWLRWIRFSNNPETVAKHIVVSIDKLKKGMKRPCCFNTAACTVPAVSKSGALIDAY